MPVTGIPGGGLEKGVTSAVVGVASVKGILVGGTESAIAELASSLGAGCME